jgi:hypothetical protein
MREDLSSPLTPLHPNTCSILLRDWWFILNIPFGSNRSPNAHVPIHVSCLPFPRAQQKFLSAHSTYFHACRNGGCLAAARQHLPLPSSVAGASCGTVDLFCSQPTAGRTISPRAIHPSPSRLTLVLHSSFCDPTRLERRRTSVILHLAVCFRAVVNPLDSLSILAHTVALRRISERSLTRWICYTF